MEKKSFLATEVLCLLFGFLGVHRYYTGYIGLGVVQTLTLGGCGLWSMIDFIFISLGKYKDAYGQELDDYNKNIGVGALILVLILGICSAFGPKFTNNHSVINNNYSSSSEAVTKKVVFKDAECTVDKHGYICDGNLTDEEQAKLDKIKAEMQ